MRTQTWFTGCLLLVGVLVFLLQSVAGAVINRQAMSNRVDFDYLCTVPYDHVVHDFAEVAEICDFGSLDVYNEEILGQKYSRYSRLKFDLTDFDPDIDATSVQLILYTHDNLYPDTAIEIECKNSSNTSPENFEGTTVGTLNSTTGTEYGYYRVKEYNLTDILKTHTGEYIIIKIRQPDTDVLDKWLTFCCRHDEDHQPVLQITTP